MIARFSLFTRELSVLSHVPQSSPALSTAFGTAMALSGVACAVFGAFRYVETAKALRAGGNAAMTDGAAFTIAGAIAVIGTIVTLTFFAYR